MTHWISPNDIAAARRAWSRLPKPARRLLESLAAEIASLLKDSGRIANQGFAIWRRRWLSWTGLALGALACVIVWVMPNDVVWLTAVTEASMAHSPDLVRRLAMLLSWWGDLFGFNLGVVAAVYAWSKYRESLHWRRVAIACVVGTCICGSIATTVRFAAGRARPTSRQPPAFHGPDLRAKYQSFPSGHTATAFGMAVPLAVSAPVIGVPTLLAAASISWSRMQRNQHYPADILGSIILALCVGVPLGCAVRRRRRD